MVTRWRVLQARQYHARMPPSRPRNATGDSFYAWDGDTLIVEPDDAGDVGAKELVIAGGGEVVLVKLVVG